MKTIKTKKLNIAICYNNLRNTAPKEFPTMIELDKTPGILETLKEAVPKFVESSLEGEKMNADIISGKMKKEEISKMRNEYIQKATKFEIEHGDEVIEVEFENDDFNVFFQQCERWGKLWFVKLEAFIGFRKDLNEGNKHVKK